MSTKYEIKRGTADDLDKMQAVFVASIHATCTKDYSSDQIKAWVKSVEDKQRWLKKISDHEFYLAFHKNNLAGFASLASGSYIDFIYTHPDHQRKGLASLLLNTVEERAVQLGAQCIQSDISITTLPFIKKKGYTVIRKNENPFHGEILINYRVQKELKESI